MGYNADNHLPPTELDPGRAADVPAVKVDFIVMWQDERVKDAQGFLARRLLGWFYQRDMIVYGNAYFMEYGCAVKYFHPSEVMIEPLNAVLSGAANKT